MSPEQLDSTDTELQLTNAQIYLYGAIAAIVALLFTCCTSITFWQLSSASDAAEAEFDRNRNQPVSIDEGALRASLQKYFSTDPASLTRITHKLLKPYQDPYTNASYPWVYLFDKSRLLSQGITEAYGGTKNLRITKYLTSKMIVEEPTFADDLVPGCASTKLIKLTSRAEPELTRKPNESDLKQLFQRNKSTFEKLKKMLDAEKAVNRVSFCHINDFWIADDPKLTSTKDAILSTKRYNEYLKLLNESRCESVSYGSEIRRPLPTSGNEIWFQMWQSLTGEPLAKWIVYSKDGSIPRNSIKQDSIDTFSPIDKGRSWASTPIDSHWYIVGGYRPNQLHDFYENGGPSDDWLRTLYLNEKSKFGELNAMLGHDKAFRLIGNDYIQAWDSVPLPINKATEQAMITPARYQKYFDLLRSLHCISYGHQAPTSAKNTIELWYYFWGSNHDEANKFLVFNKSGKLPNGCVEVAETDIGDFRHAKETLLKCVRIGPQWFIVSAIWKERQS